MADDQGQWAPDPMHRYELRWWDGQHWTAYVADKGVVSSDPLLAPPPPTSGSTTGDVPGSRSAVDVTQVDSSPTTNPLGTALAASSGSPAAGLAATATSGVTASAGTADSLAHDMSQGPTSGSVATMVSQSAGEKTDVVDLRHVPDTVAGGIPMQYTPQQPPALPTARRPLLDDEQAGLAPEIPITTPAPRSALRQDDITTALPQQLRAEPQPPMEVPSPVGRHALPVPEPEPADPLEVTSLLPAADPQPVEALNYQPTPLPDRQALPVPEPVTEVFPSQVAPVAATPAAGLTPPPQAHSQAPVAAPSLSWDDLLAPGAPSLSDSDRYADSWAETPAELVAHRPRRGATFLALLLGLLIVAALAWTFRDVLLQGNNTGQQLPYPQVTSSVPAKTSGLGAGAAEGVLDESIALPPTGATRPTSTQPTSESAAATTASSSAPATKKSTAASTTARTTTSKAASSPARSKPRDLRNAVQ